MAKNDLPSSFYHNCRENKYEIVEELINQLSLAEMDKMEPNGSTALHAVCYFGYERLISLLLSRGFTRRVKNKFGLTPIDECPEEFKRLFLRPKTSNRFGGSTSFEKENSIWFNVTNNNSSSNIYQNKDIYNGNRLVHGIFHADAICQQLKAKKMTKVDVIERLFRRAIDERDCVRLIQALTTETEFHDVINQFLLAQTNGLSPSPLSEFIDTICSNSSLHHDNSFKGKCYRAIKVKSKNDLEIYEKDSKLLNRIFLSTTKNRQFALEYVDDRQVDSDYIAILCFDIRHDQSALDIAHLSEFPHEDEVLIMINRVFRVISVTSTNNGSDFAIELKESKR